LPAGDWPPLAAAPGVCYRLLTQAALGLAAAHRQGLVHGHLEETSLILTADGTIKICGLGEPAWLRGGSAAEGSHTDDLRALGKIAASWCMPAGVRKGAKAKPLPPALVAILDRLSGDQLPAYADAQQLLNDLDQADADIPANAEAWDRLLKHVRDHAAPEATLRLSA